MTKPARILIVDDDETVLQTFAKALSLKGTTCRSPPPLVGLRRSRTSPDAILLDLRMPFVNGIGFSIACALSDHHHTRWRSSPATRADDPAMVNSSTSS
jgi:CheY-like chemotaxis protein